MFDRRAYQVQGKRPDGSLMVRYFLKLDKAERSAETMSRASGERPALEDVRLIRSAPIRWLYPEKQRTHSPLPELAKRQGRALEEVIGLHQRNDLTGACFVCIDVHDTPQEWPCETVAVVQEAMGFMYERMNSINHEEEPEGD